MRLSLLSGLSVVYKRESSAYDDLLYRISKRNRSDLSKSDHPETKISPSKSSSKGRPGDWRVQCTRDWHLHQYLLENRATLTEEFGWATREDKVAFGCRPASRYTGAPYEKMHNIKFNCTVCHRRKEIPMTHARALAALVTPAYHMWKYVRFEFTIHRGLAADAFLGSARTMRMAGVPMKHLIIAIRRIA